MTHNRPYRSHGIAMILVLVTLAVAVVVSLSFSKQQQTANGIIRNARDHMQAKSIAESGLAMAIRHVRTDDGWRTNLANGLWVNGQLLDGGTLTLAGVDGIDLDGDGLIDSDGSLLDDLTDPITITATGRYNGTVHTVRAEVWPAVLGQVLRVLMIVADAADLSEAEEARRQLVESFGMAVTVIDDDATESAIAQASQNHDVIYVSSTAAASDLDDKLRDAPIGIVNERTGLNVDLGLAAGVVNFGGWQLDLADNDHYITETLPAGTVGITDTSQPLVTLLGLVPPGSRLLGKRPLLLTPSLVATDAGQATLAGTAIARRVTLPWGGSGFDVNALTEDGQTILERALQWSGAPISVTPNDVGLGVTQRLYLQDDGMVDSWNSGLGPYSDTNRTQEAIISTNAVSSNMLRVLNNGTLHGSLYVGPGGDTDTVTMIDASATVTGAMGVLGEAVPMPDNSIPQGMPASEGDVEITSGTTVISGNRRFNRLDIRYDAIVRIEGAVNIVCDTSFNMYDNSQVQLAEGATLKVWGHHTSDAIHFEDNARFNMNTWDASRATMYVVGGGEFDMDGSPQVCARVIAPDGYLDVNDDTHFYGTFLGQKIVVEQRGQLHHDKRISPYPDTDPYEEHDNTPQLILEYKFEQPPVPTPQLISRWRLDETAGIGGGMVAGGKLSVITGAQVDSYRSADGPYGGDNVGGDALIATNSTASGKIKIDGSPTIVRGHAYVGPGGDPATVIDGIDSVTGETGAMDSEVALGGYTAPTGMPVAGGTLTVTSNQTWTGDLHYDKIDIDGATVTVSGHVRVLCDNQFRMRQTARLVVPAGSSIDIYAVSQVRVENDAVLNPDTDGASRVNVYVLDGGGDIIVETRAHACGQFHSAGKGYIKTDAHVYGSFVAVNEIKCETDARYHADVSIHDLGIAPPSAVDQTGSSDGVYRNGVTLGQSGADGYAPQFDGVDDYVVMPHTPAYALDSGAVALWFKSDDVMRTGGLLTKDASGTGSGGHMGIYQRNGQVYAGVADTSSTHWTNGGALSAGQWHHVVFSWGAAGLKLYINGQVVDNDEYTGGLGDTSGGAGNEEPIVLGASGSRSPSMVLTPTDHHFAGWIDDVRIYDRGIDDLQAASLFAGGEPGVGAGVGATVVDTSGFGVAVDLDIDDTSRVQWHEGGGLTFLDATRAISAGPASKLYEQLTDTGEFTFEVKFTPANTDQAGPAQILSYALSGSDRNFSVGQSQTVAGVRVHTADTTSNGTPDVVAADDLEADAVEHLIVTYDGEAVHVYRNGALVASEPRSSTMNWSPGDLLALGNEVGTDRPWLGRLHRVAVYNRALNGSQVQSVTQGGTPQETDETRPFRFRWREMR